MKQQKDFMCVSFRLPLSAAWESFVYLFLFQRPKDDHFDDYHLIDLLNLDKKDIETVRCGDIFILIN